LLGGAPEGHDARLLGLLVQAAGGRDVVFIAHDDAHMARLGEAFAFFHPGHAYLALPAWDCVPYDRISPNPAIVARRAETLAHLAEGTEAGRLVLTTVNAVLQRLPPGEAFAGRRLAIAVGADLGREALIAYLAGGGYQRTGTVMEPGEFAPRGGLVDLYPPGADEPVRVDFFGDEVESIRSFDPLTQRSDRRLDRVVLGPTGETPLDAASIARFRAGYREAFGAMTAEDPMYVAVCAGRRYPGMEHWLPLFHERLVTLFDYLPGAVICLDHLAGEAVTARLATIADHYAARREVPASETAAVYRPLPPERLYLSEEEWGVRLGETGPVHFAPYRIAPRSGAVVVDGGGKQAPRFADARAKGADPFTAVAAYVRAEAAAGRRVLLACYGTASRERIVHLLGHHGVTAAAAADWSAAKRLAADAVAAVVLGLEHGFESADLVVLAEQDVLGDRLVRPPRRTRRADAFIAEATSLEVGDLVVHVDHGIGRYQGLETLTLDGAPHDCVRLVYAGDDVLYVPVENIEMLSRYGAGDGPVQLDRLGGVQWQARKARLKRRIREMAGELVRIAAARRLRPAPVLSPPEGAYEEFCARFPFVETEDQQRAIDEVLADLRAGRPMDRLVCGDVGFGKTEVALRAAFVAALAGKQVAVVTPTTLLCRQHFASFRQRFADFPVVVEQLSRLVPAKRAAAVKAGLAAGKVDIVIGTHALLGKAIAFRDLGLIVVDEEQHFGVAHKERLKAMCVDVHVLTLTATPIPRTLQMALSGVRELSLIATPPVDRLAVRTFITPYDPVVVREALLREHFRGGQSFVVCPRIEDIERLVARLERLVPEVRIAVAHGRLPARTLESVMLAFYDGSYDVLVSTAIIESGLDLPNVNTMVVYRAHLFGLAQLYQLRGRIGRAKVRAYAYLTLPAAGGLSAAATKRLEVMNKLDALGAGFTLASHDLDIRGAGTFSAASSRAISARSGSSSTSTCWRRPWASSRRGPKASPRPRVRPGHRRSASASPP